MEEKKLVDPSALGLFGLAMVTLVASMQKFDLVNGTLFVIPWAIFLGAIAQLIAGFLDYKKGNAFGGLAFIGYGLFWLAIALTWSFQNGIINAANSGDKNALGFAYLGYLVFTLIMTVGSLKTNKVLFIIFLLIDVLFLGLSLTTFNLLNDFSHYLAATAELLIAIFSFYGCAANIINIQFRAPVLPVGGPVLPDKNVTKNRA